MAKQFLPDEIDQIINVAKILAPDITRDQYNLLIESQKQLGEVGFCEATWAVAHLQQEKGINYREAVNAIEKLLYQKAHLEGNLNKLKETISKRKTEFQEASEALQKINIELQQAGESLMNVRNQRQQEEQALSALREEASKEKERLSKELEDCRKAAAVAVVEIEEAGKLKKEFQKRGYDLDLALTLCQEFSKTPEPRKRLAEELKKYGSLKNSLAVFNQESEAKKSALQADINDLDVKKEQLTISVANLQAEYAQQVTQVSKLTAEISGKNSIMNFYRRYRDLRDLIEYLGRFNEVTFHHCNWCGSLFWIIKRGGTPYSSFKCPWCSFTTVEPDGNAYLAAKQPISSLKLLP